MVKVEDCDKFEDNYDVAFKKKFKPSILEASSIERQKSLGKGGYEIPMLHDVQNQNNDLRKLR